MTACPACGHGRRKTCGNQQVDSKPSDRNALDPSRQRPTGLCRRDKDYGCRRMQQHQQHFVSHGDFRCTCGQYRQQDRDEQQANFQGDSNRSEKIGPHREPCLFGSAGKSQSIYAVPGCRVADCRGQDFVRRTRQNLLFGGFELKIKPTGNRRGGIRPQHLPTQLRVCSPGCRSGASSHNPEDWWQVQRSTAAWNDNNRAAETAACRSLQLPTGRFNAADQRRGIRPSAVANRISRAGRALSPPPSGGGSINQPYEAGQEAQGGQSFRNSLGARWAGNVSSTSMSSSGGRSPSHQVGMEG